MEESTHAVARTTGGWAVSGTAPTVVKPVANIDFPECTASPGNPITHFSVGTGVADNVLYSGTVTPNITEPVLSLSQRKMSDGLQ